MDYTDYLQRWRKAGLIDDATADRITEFESNGSQDGGGIQLERPSLVEALLYLGLVVVAVGVITLVGNNWEQMESWARILAVAVPGGLALVLGFALRATNDRPFTRAGHVAWFLAVALTFLAILVAFNEYAATDDERTGFLVGAFATLALALALWAISSSIPQLVALAGAIFLFAQALGNWPDDFSTAIAGTAALIGGAVAVALTEVRVFQPRSLAAPLFGLLAAAGAYEAGIDDSLPWAETMAFIVAGALMALGLVRATFGYLVVGVALAFLALVTLMFEYFESDLGAPVALIISGALLVAAVLALIPLRRVVAATRSHG